MVYRLKFFKMKVFLIQPPIQDFYDTDVRLQPIGLAYLKSTAKKFLPEIEVRVFDFHQGYGKKTLPLPKEMKYLRDFWQCDDKSPFCGFYQYYHFGANFSTIAEIVFQEKPQLVGISALFSPYYREVIATARAIKEKQKIPILVGGSQVSAMPEFMLSFPEIDYVIVGEGEKPFVEFLKFFFYGQDIQKVPNLGYKKDGKIYFNQKEENYPLNIIPPPDFSDLKKENYTLAKKPLAFVITSRSCPHRCSFCSVHTTFGYNYRHRGITDVLAEIENLYAQGYKIIDFEDDNLTFYKSQMKELCQKIIERFSQKDISFVAMNGISYLSLDEELLCLMRKANFTHLNLSLVSSNATVLKTTQRPHTVKKYLEIVEKAFSLGFAITSYQILGLPMETISSMVHTLSFHARLPVLIGPSLFYLTPNSPIAKNFPPASERDVFLARGSAMAIETKNFSRAELYTLFLTTRILNFLKGLDIPPETSLSQILQQNPPGKVSLGLKLLQYLFYEKKLLAYTKKGFFPLKNFLYPLFLEVIEQAKYIRTQKGQVLYLDVPKNGLPTALKKLDSFLEMSLPQSQVAQHLGQ